MCQCMYINCNKGTTLVGDAENGGYDGKGYMGNLSVLSPKFYCEP